MIDTLIEFWNNLLVLNKLVYILFPFIILIYIWFKIKEEKYQSHKQDHLSNKQSKSPVYKVNKRE